MTDRQYRQLLRNRRRRRLAPLFQTESRPGVLRSIARRARQRDRGARALARVLPSEWLKVSHVEGVQRDVLLVVVTDPDAREEMRRQRGRLQRELRHHTGALWRLWVR
jgi:hypothetical protein